VRFLIDEPHYLTVYEDPIVGILFGVTISLLIFVEKLSKGQYEHIINDTNKAMTKKYEGEGDEGQDLVEIPADTLVYTFKGQLAYVNGQSHLQRFETGFKKPFKNIIFRFRGVYFIDLDGIEIFDEIVEHLLADGKKVLVSGVSPIIEPLLETSKVYKELKAKNLAFEKGSDALKALGYNL
jgi:MFS superfamily sulfate permease-like transporter